MSWKRPHSGFETDIAPVTTRVHKGAATCPMSDQALQTVVVKETFDRILLRMERGNPPLFDYLIEKRNRKAARRRTVRRAGFLEA
jgi:hypothetical protein